MRPKLVIGLFFIGLLLLVGLELTLIWGFAQATSLPTIKVAWWNALLGLLAMVGGGLVIIWSVSVQFTLGKGTPAPMLPTQKLVVRGPYAYSRNPMTLGAAAFYLGLGIYLGSIGAIILVLLVFAALLAYLNTHETKELTERFGAEYLEYKRKTPFLIPRLRRRS